MDMRVGAVLFPTLFVAGGVLVFYFRKKFTKDAGCLYLTVTFALIILWGYGMSYTGMCFTSIGFRACVFPCVYGGIISAMPFLFYFVALIGRGVNNLILRRRNPAEFERRQAIESEWIDRHIN